MILSNVGFNEKREVEFRKSVKKMDKSVVSAYDVVDVNKEVKNLDAFVKSVLFGKVICKDLK